MTPATCRNCDAPLSGPYCAQCGQHAHESARTLGALLHEAWHVITHVDGRFWTTLWLLLVKPGQLTLEYFADRRARYMPPVRLYIVISIVFFGLGSIDSLFKSDVEFTDGSGQKHSVPDLAQLQAEIQKQEARAAAARSAPSTASSPSTTPAPSTSPAPISAPAPTAAPAPTTPSAVADEDGDKDKDEGIGIVNWDAKDCSTVHSKWHWLEQGLTKACQRNIGDHGKTIGHAFVANIPKMMFIFLPLIATVMLPLYWFPRRYYVEHLVFVLHNHAALFLAMVVVRLLGLLALAVPVLHVAVSAGSFGVFLYAVWYVYRATRRYYGQGRWLTLGKLALVGTAYLVCLALTMLANAVVSALIT